MTSICSNCKKEILPGQTALNAMEKIFHKECFVCSECKGEMGGTMFKVVEGKNICDACFNKKKAEQQKSAGVCGKCKLDIKGQFLGAMDKKFHLECFICTKCGANISKTSFQVKENAAYCIDCYTVLFAPKCFICESLIKPTEPYLEVESRTIHKTCFICSTCKTPLAGKPFGVKKNTYYCQPHAIKAR